MRRIFSILYINSLRYQWIKSSILTSSVDSLLRGAGVSMEKRIGHDKWNTDNIESSTKSLRMDAIILREEVVQRDDLYKAQIQTDM